MNVIVLFNRHSGSAKGWSGDDPRLLAMFHQAGLDAEIRHISGEHLRRAATAAMKESPAAVVAAGGDGTVSSVASALAGGQVPLGLLPLGTFNHFAKDVGIPSDPAKAVKIIAAGHVRQVDAAQVNGNIFINNSSIGIYPQIVRHRDEQRMRLGRGKWLAMLFAVGSAFRRFPTLKVRIGLANRTVLRTTPFVFVGNNAYEMSLFNVRDRIALDRGELSLYVANRTGRFGVLRLAFALLLGSLDQAKDFDSTCVGELHIESPRRRLHVSLDGEIRSMSPPLHFQSLPGALHVLAPPAGDGAT